MTKKRKFSEGLFDTETILKSLEICFGQTVLDAGCGNGYMAKKFSGLVGQSGKIYALDHDKEFINNLKKETNNTNINAFVGDISKTTRLKNCIVDLVYLSTVFHIFSEIQIAGFEKEVSRIAKPGSKIAILNINKEKTPFGPPMEMRSSPEELRQKLSFVPLELVEVSEHFYMQIFAKM